MFDNDYGKINIDGSSLEIDKLSIEELKKYLEICNTKEKELIEKQNEYLSQLLG